MLLIIMVLKTTIEDAASKGDLTVGLSDEDWIRMAFVTLQKDLLK